MARITLVTLLAVAVMGCGTAAVPAEVDSGAMVVPAPEEGKDKVKASPTATPTPLPTTCITGPNEDFTGTVEDCYTPLPGRPTKYEKIEGNLDQMAQDAEEAEQTGQSDQAQQEGGGGSSGAETTYVRVTIMADEFVENGEAEIVKWLEGQGIRYRYNGLDHHPIYAVMPVRQLGPLSELEAVQYVDEPAVPGIPTPREPSQ